VFDTEASNETGPHADPGTRTDAGPIGADLGKIGADLGLIGIDHVGIAVPDLDAALDFYAKVFGLRCIHAEINEEQGVHEAMLQVGADPDGPRIQLLAPLSPDSPIGTFIDRRGPGLQQLAYTVEDVDRAAAVLRERGVRLLYDVPRKGTAGSLVNFVHPKDAGGVLVELVQPGPTAQYT
jgi:methylmalonyl-CoA/ethylmalonyl-CoA epimerase